MRLQSRQSLVHLPLVAGTRRKRCSEFLSSCSEPQKTLLGGIPQAIKTCETTLRARARMREIPRSMDSKGLPRLATLNATMEMLMAERASASLPVAVPVLHFPRLVASLRGKFASAASRSGIVVAFIIRHDALQAAGVEVGNPIVGDFSRRPLHFLEGLPTPRAEAHLLLEAPRRRL
mmetsp:Transcript_10629/g.24204  ORF Transcript_10629/g.24204 Transcript_10629/m.24204 type:complete len:177 (-) Transcript_10629:344-874(-)